VCSGPALDWKIGVEIFHLATVVTHIQWILEALSMRVKWLGNGATQRPELCFHKYADSKWNVVPNFFSFIVPFISPHHT